MGWALAGDAATFRERDQRLSVVSMWWADWTVRLSLLFEPSQSH